MITFLKGVIVEKQPTRVVVDVCGVGYEVFIPLSSYDHLPAEDEHCQLLTHDYLREDQHTLYGFRTDAERTMFGMLLSISGIGPKLALSALSGLSVKELKAAVATGDTKRLSAIPGVGRKTAERIVVELRDRIGAAEAFEAVAGGETATGENIRARDAVLALISLGYKQTEARRMVEKTMAADPSIADTEDIIRRTLVQ